jgi:KDO2-lipid IV(A) lauroyltransferase
VSAFSRRERVPLFTAKDLLWLLYLYPFRLLSAGAPRSVLYSVARAAEPLVQLLAREGRTRATRWLLAACPGMTPAEAQRVAWRAVSNNIFSLVDNLLLHRPSVEPLLRCDGIEGLEHLERAMAAGRGVLVLSGHFCANRVGQRYLAARGYRMLCVGNQRPSNGAEGRLGRAVVQPRYAELRRLAHQEVVYIQDAERGLKILQRLRAGGLVNLHLDGVPGTRIVEYPFLGVRRCLPAGAFDLARASGCAVVPMLCLGRSTGFRIRVGPQLDVAPAASREEFVTRNAPVFAQAVEGQIMENPEEWQLWTHPWGTLSPPGAPRPDHAGRRIESGASSSSPCT